MCLLHVAVMTTKFRQKASRSFERSHVDLCFIAQVIRELWKGRVIEKVSWMLQDTFSGRLHFKRRRSLHEGLLSETQALTISQSCIFRSHIASTTVYTSFLKPRLYRCRYFKTEVVCTGMYLYLLSKVLIPGLGIVVGRALQNQGEAQRLKQICQFKKGFHSTLFYYIICRIMFLRWETLRT